MSYKLSKNNVGRPSSFTTEHESYIRELLDKDPQFFSENIIETRYEWFMRWKDSDVNFTNDYIFIDEAGFHINLRNNCKADTGTPVIFIIEEPATEYVDDNNESNAQDSSESISKDLKGNYLVMNNCIIHKSKPMMKKIESYGYKLIYLSPYSPELNPIEQFWAILKGKLKRHKLLTEEKMSDRIAETCNTIPSEILYNFASHSERQSIQCYNKTPF
ncbi:hypothetical protein RO3G_09772 [Rhizopus delemar RA 99-880]|uniref:Tc1-like transposase DDE domain-containing protein n=1 Tax=Rhizopus delemar (strain RA 99-880 / ATCC MYA-4621 / FGSC 9543 / NRRL 43880) TaxID=246409 RepID=I1C9D2_RHIO9|nr:hypothetical protein RO3G_09772 [Rhizopus delemar RA 99-880]|eukprot:EIE85062.1 hypothetical protein RO3G_09772 [Rhizopus delemar RA 99-880]